jgi:sucrose phosphorylase
LNSISEEQLIRQQLQFLYGDQGDQVWLELQERITEFASRNPSLSHKKFVMNEQDAILITYGDQFQDSAQRDLQALREFLSQYLAEEINWIHLLPFYPYSSDDGFSVINYRQVNPDIGTWDDIAHLAEEYHLMFDAVVNHISRRSDWFQAFQQGKSPYQDYFITVDPNTDLSSIFRPRALPLLTPVRTVDGEVYVWTTFSDDQIDLNFSNPQVLLEVIDLLLFYAERGASLIRLDAIGYVWKMIGTSSLNLPQAHGIVKIVRNVLNLAAPQVGIITETNVPHEENIMYFGDSFEVNDSDGKPFNGDEAQLVYQFSLAPLVLHSLNRADVTALSRWADTLSVPYQNTAFFNFIASHDGIGVMPAKGLLNEEEIDALIDKTVSHGGEVSYKTNADGSRSVYELNITLYDALNNPSSENPVIDVNRFLASQAIMLSLAGVPGIYIHSLFGSQNCKSCVADTGRARSINREKFHLNDLREKLDDPDNLHSRVFFGYRQLLRIRRGHPAFHPAAPQRVIKSNSQVFTLLRTSLDQSEYILCLVNVSSTNQKIEIDLKSLDIPVCNSLRDLISGKPVSHKNGMIKLILEGYQVMWLFTGSPSASN